MLERFANSKHSFLSGPFLKRKLSVVNRVQDLYILFSLRANEIQNESFSQFSFDGQQKHRNGKALGPSLCATTLSKTTLSVITFSKTKLHSDTANNYAAQNAMPIN
jgi:hypothetical protein